LSVHYSPQRYFTTLDATDRATLAAQLIAALGNAGWTTVDVTGGTTLLQSATTPQGLSCRFAVIDPGDPDVCVQTQFRTTDELLQQGKGGYLQPGFVANERLGTFVFVGNPYQFFVLPMRRNANLNTTRRDTLMGGLPWLPTFLVGTVTAAIWTLNNGSYDTTSIWENDFTFKQTFGPGTPNERNGCAWTVLNGASFQPDNSNETPDVLPRIIIPSGARLDQPTAAYRWYDNSFLQSDALLAFDAVSGGEAKVVGQLWDTVFISGQKWPGSVINMDGHNWYAICDYNVYLTPGIDNEFTRPGNLWVAYD